MTIDGVFSNMASRPEPPPNYVPQTMKIIDTHTSSEPLPTYDAATMEEEDSQGRTPIMYFGTYTLLLLTTGVIAFIFPPFVFSMLMVSVIFANRYAILGVLGAAGCIISVHSVTYAIRDTTTTEGETEYLKFIFLFTLGLGGVVAFLFTLMYVIMSLHTKTGLRINLV